METSQKEAAGKKDKENKCVIQSRGIGCSHAIPSSGPGIMLIFMSDN